MKKNMHSIAREVNRSSQLMTWTLLFPALISLATMLIYVSSYSVSTARMEAVAAMKPVVTTELPDKLWYIIADRDSFANSDLYASLDEINVTLEDLIQHSEDEESGLELTVARRTMNTLEGYVRAIEQNIIESKPVVDSEATLEEVRSVAALIGNMLDNVTSHEVTNVGFKNRRLGNIVLVSVGAELVLLLVSLAISFQMRRRLARSIHEPIVQLEHFAGLVADGNLRARVPSTDIQELSTLTDRVNIMADRLESLIEQNQREQENLKKAELRTLQAQINPHFLYNTLDTIVWQAESGHSGEVIQITKALSDFFRISLSSGADWIPIEQEIKHLLGYLSIQKIRYRDILDYEVLIPDELRECYILKLLLQPLVENALYHGIKYKRGGGKITVQCVREENSLLFSVRDTGRGMTEEQLRNVRNSLATGVAAPRLESMPDSTASGFGLYNVDQRIRLYYNQESGLVLESDSGGTCVSFRTPIKREEELRV
ncbi:MAG: sensor histidine kinase [Eubacteriales bacterium]|nr:sensor histidine kinase [Eubacteriales bacterium]